MIMMTKEENKYVLIYIDKDLDETLIDQLSVAQKDKTKGKRTANDDTDVQKKKTTMEELHYDEVQLTMQLLNTR